MSMKNKSYWVNWVKKAGIRAIKTIAQAAIAGIGTAAAMGQVDWKYVLSAAVLGWGIVHVARVCRSAGG